MATRAWHTSPMDKSRRQVFSYIAVTFLFSWLVMGAIAWKGGMAAAGFWILLVMWIPGLVTIGMRLVTRDGWGDAGWKFGNFRYWILAILVPFAIAGVSYALAWALGVSTFSPPSAEMLARNDAASTSHLILKVLPILFFYGCFGAFGEELGWRGYLLPKLYEARLKRPLIISSVIWGAWHLPLILGAGYASSNYPLLSAALFMLTILSAGTFAGWLRMRSGSIWVVMGYHAAHNLFFQTAFEIFNRPGDHSALLSGESGVIPCAVYGFTIGVSAWWLKKSVGGKTH